MKDNKLEVGDVLYSSHYHHLSKHVITRVTAKRAYSKTSPESNYELEYKRDVRGNYVDGYASTRGGTLEREDIKSEYELQQAKTRVRSLLDSIQVSKLTMAQCASLIDFIHELKSEVTV